MRTRRELGPLGTPLFGSRPLLHGRFGWDVAVLQYLLNKHGVHVPLNAYMDKPTVEGIAPVPGVAASEARTGSPVPARSPRSACRTACPCARSPSPFSLKRYVVKPGDSLTAIARRSHTTLSKLAHVNGIDPAHPLLIGTALRLPAAVATAAGPTAVSASNATEVRASLDKWAAYYGIDPSLARALAWMESGFNNSVVSSVGAQGVMQLLPSTWDYVEKVLIGHAVQHDADGNVQVGLAYLHHLLGAFGGDEHLALAGWYQGERAVKASGPYKVSKVFVANVLALRDRM